MFGLLDHAEREAPLAHTERLGRPLQSGATPFKVGAGTSRIQRRFPDRAKRSKTSELLLGRFSAGCITNTDCRKSPLEGEINEKTSPSDHFSLGMADDRGVSATPDDSSPRRAGAAPSARRRVLCFSWIAGNRTRLV